VMNSWNQIFKKEGVLFTSPHQDMPKVSQLFFQNNVKKILDLGCGSGRHVVFLAKKGFDVYGIDQSEHGIKLATQWLKKENVSARLKVGDIYKPLAYDDNIFDAIIATDVIHHGVTENIKKAISEISRVLKVGGMMFLTVPKRISNEDLRKDSSQTLGKPQYAKKIEENVFVPLGGREKGIPHFLFDQHLIETYFKGFEIHDLHILENAYCFIGAKQPKIHLNRPYGLG
jgi:ubiquinone/menaquinone biosynthesis C-methylase UbiE